MINIFGGGGGESGTGIGENGANVNSTGDLFLIVGN